MVGALERFPDPRDKPGMTVPEAGRWLGLGKDATYKAAQEGRIKTMRFGHRRIVPTAWLAAELELEFPSTDSRPA